MTGRADDGRQGVVPAGPPPTRPNPSGSGSQGSPRWLFALWCCVVVIVGLSIGHAIARSQADDGPARASGAVATAESCAL